jgi:hypothetical protein
MSQSVWLVLRGEGIPDAYWKQMPGSVEYVPAAGAAYTEAHEDFYRSQLWEATQKLATAHADITTLRAEVARLAAEHDPYAPGQCDPEGE